MLLAEAFGIPSDSIELIYNGTSGGVSGRHSAEEAAAVRREVREELGIELNAPIVLSVGRLSRQKGYALFLPILADVLKAFPAIRFVWVGDGEERTSLEHELEARRLRQHVLLPGHRSDVHRLYAAADLFVLPTMFEGHPFSLLEAMAHGVPVIASDASGIPEILQHEVHGLVFPAGDCEALKAALLDALRNPAKMRQLAAAAAARVRDFSEEQMVGRTLQVLRSLAQQSSSTPS
jgi:glycosyltransferase involved in cell wall biosynthesis